MDRLFTTSEVARLLSVSSKRVLALKDSGELGCVTLGARTFRFEQSEVERFIAEQKGNLADRKVV